MVAGDRTVGFVYHNLSLDHRVRVGLSTFVFLRE